VCRQRQLEGEVSVKKIVALGVLAVAGALATAGVAVAYWDTDGTPEVTPSIAQAGMSNACEGGTKIEGVDGDVVSGDYPMTFDGFSDTVRITVTQTDQGPTFAFRVLNYPDDHVMTSVLVKGGPLAVGSNWYDYGSAGPWDANGEPPINVVAPGVSNDDGLHSPLNTKNKNGKWYGLSHICFFTDKGPFGS
jgi:hypothetical protein